jgi:hypothetical protein
MIQYEFDDKQGLSATDFMYIRVGFITKKKQGILIQLRNEKNTEYISLEMNNNGKYTFVNVHLLGSCYWKECESPV